MGTLRFYGVAIVGLIFMAMVLLFVTKPLYPSVNLLHYGPQKTQGENKCDNLNGSLI